MKISFQMIVFNAMSVLPNDMLILCIENVLPFAEEIIIVEGATKAIQNHYWDGDTSSFTSDGRSNDGTIEVLQALHALRPDKIKLIIGDGFWNGKTEMCNAAAKIATGDYIWQLDSDEFYRWLDIEKINNMLEAWKPDQVDFYANHFWGDFNHCIDERELTWGNDIPWRRIFRNVPGKSYWSRHEPPVYICNGLQTDQGNVITREQTLKAGIKLYHYSYVQKSQIDFKSKFFNNLQYPEFWLRWNNDNSTRVFGSKVYPFEGEHPKIIKEYYKL